MFGMNRALLLACVLLLPACAAAVNPIGPRQRDARLRLVAAFPDRQVTGVAVAPASDRVFVCFPRWSASHELSVAEVLADGSVVPYPDESWNRYQPELDSAPGTRFVCVQSVVADDQNRLWVLDPAAPQFEGPVPGGPKLISIDLKTDAVERIYSFPPEIAPPGSYLNDVRLDTDRRYAYLTDSGLGALIVVNLDTGLAHRVLDDHPSTRSEGVVPSIGGKPWKRADGTTPDVHADGLALSPDGEWLYYHALTGLHTYRIPTRALREDHARPNRLAAAVEDLGQDAVTDGMLMDGAGNLYLTALEWDAILVRRPTGKLDPLVIDPRLRWPDSLALDAKGSLYITTSQIHLPNPTAPYALWRVDAKLPTRP
jgi:sugar lactone lactonase YvrE